MPKTVEESLLGDHSDQWMDSDCPEAKRLKVSYTAYLKIYNNLINLFNVMKMIKLEFSLPVSLG